jgi:hypothetical protein
MIVTHNIKLNADDLFYLLVGIYLKRRWWMVVWVWAMVVFLLFRSELSIAEYLLILLLIIFQFILVAQYWIFAHSKKNKIYLQTRHFEINTDQIVEYVEDGTSNKYSTEQFLKVMKTGRYYLLFVARNEFLYLPVSAFRSPEDREWFENVVEKKNKNLHN